MLTPRAVGSALHKEDMTETKPRKPLFPDPSPALPAATAGPITAVETVLMARNGRVLRGPAGTGLPEAAAYTAQMADLIGEFLGLEGFRSLDASFDDIHYRISRNSDGGLTAQRGPDPSRFEQADDQAGRGA